MGEKWKYPETSLKKTNIAKRKGLSAFFDGDTKLLTGKRNLKRKRNGETHIAKKRPASCRRGGRPCRAMVP